MVSNLSTIGFAFESDGEFDAAMTRLAASAARRIPASEDGYAVWRSDTGAELWFHHDAAAQEFSGLTPFFEGKSDVPLKVLERHRRPGDSKFEGALLAWVVAADGSGGVYPLVFDAVDFLALADRSLPGFWRVRLVGFAHQIRAFPSGEAYDASQSSEPKFSPKAFIPVGMFASASAGQDVPPSSAALLTGRVGVHRLLTNEVTGQRFHWLFVESLEAGFDIIVEPAAVDGDILVGGTVEVSCWLFGRALG